MSNPAVSVLIPTYNYARFLPEAIESVLAQDFTDFELIIADDASSDNTVAVCQRYAERDPRIRFVRHEKNLGMVGNWNWCLNAACGKYIKYMLADDKFAQPYALTKLVAAIELPGVSLVTSARNLMDETSAITGLWNPLGTQDVVLPGQELIVRCLEKNVNLIGEPSAVLFRSDAAARAFDPEYRQLVDLEMWFYLLQQGDLAYIGKPLCNFRQHASQQTEVNRKAGTHWYEMARLCRRYLCGELQRIMLFRCLQRLKKRKFLELDRLETELRGEFTFMEYVQHYIRYKFKRFFLKFKRGVISRGL